MMSFSTNRVDEAPHLPFFAVNEGLVGRILRVKGDDGDSV